MVKKVCQIFLFVLVVGFSFYYTDQVVYYFKNKDPLMKSIKDAQNDYQVAPVNAIIEDDKIIPGYNGIEIDINKSYSKMKRLREFNPNMIYYKETKPNISSRDIFDKYIIKGNENKRTVGLIFNIRGLDFLAEVRDVMGKELTTYYLEKDVVSSNLSVVSDLVKNKNNIIVNMEETQENITWSNNLIKSFTINSNYCLTLEETQDIINICSEHKIKTIMPTFVAAKYTLNNLKKKITSGSIIFYDVTSKSVKELKSLKDYLKSKGYTLETIEKIVSENR